MGEILATLQHAGTPLTANKERTLHWSARAAVSNEWRTAFGWLGRKYRSTIKSFPVGVEAAIVAPPGNRADPAGHYPVVKAALDGLTDAGVWPDDSGDYIAWHRYHAPINHPSVAKGTVALHLWIVSLDEDWLGLHLLHGAST